MTLAFWQAGNLEAAARAVRDWARVDGDRPAAHRFAARIYEDMGAIDLAEEAAERAAERGPSDAGAWERLGRLRLRLMDREGALEALRRAIALGAGEEVRELIVQALALEPRIAEAASVAFPPGAACARGTLWPALGPASARPRGCSPRARRSGRSSAARRPTGRP